MNRFIVIKFYFAVKRQIIVAGLCTFCFFFLFAPRVLAANLEVDFGSPAVAEGAPVFTVQNMLPGDTEERQITVKNTTNSPISISIVSEKISETKNFADILDVHLYKNTTHYYGGPTAKKLEQFFTDSMSPTGLFLFTLPGNSQTDFYFNIHFPSESGNEYQLAEVVFDLVIGTTIKDDAHIVINEVYYDVSEIKGLDCPKDRGIYGINGNTLTISNNGTGSTNTINVSVQNVCTVVQQNNANIANAIQVYTNTGNNTGGTVLSGNANILTYIQNFFNYNFNFGSCNAKRFADNHEWIELYNPTDTDVSLKNWTITDNTGSPTLITANRTIPKGGYALISKDNSVWNYWNEPNTAKKIELGRDIGDGLDNTGDRVILKNPQGVIVDQMNWQTDTFVWNPGAPDVLKGHSLEREPDGFDTNIPSDFVDRPLASPGQ